MIEEVRAGPGIGKAFGGDFALRKDGMGWDVRTRS